MESLSIRASKLLSGGYTILIHTALNDRLTNDNSILLWNNAVTDIDDETYTEFKESIKRRGSKFYTMSSILSYADFCISLLCCRHYSLNHNSVPLLSHKSFTAAWRGIDTVRQIGSERVKSWINKYMSGRSSIGYQITVGSGDDSNEVTAYGISDEDIQEEDTYLLDDDAIISKAVSTGRVVEIGDRNGSVGRVTYLPESQLYGMYMNHWTRLVSKPNN